MNDIGVYVRVSTLEQNEAGQRREIERWLLGNGWGYHTTFLQFITPAKGPSVCFTSPIAGFHWHYFADSDFSCTSRIFHLSGISYCITSSTRCI